MTGTLTWVLKGPVHVGREPGDESSFTIKVDDGNDWIMFDQEPTGERSVTRMSKRGAQAFSDNLREAVRAAGLLTGWGKDGFDMGRSSQGSAERAVGKS